MVASGDRVIAGADFYQDILERMYTELEALNTADYEWATSDAWRRARYFDPTRGATRHLETWIDLGTNVSLDGPSLTHSCSLSFAARYSADNDATAQARFHAAARAAFDWLQIWHYGNHRTIPTGYSTAALNSEWVIVTVTFTLWIHRKG